MKKYSTVVCLCFFSQTFGERNPCNYNERELSVSTPVNIPSPLSNDQELVPSFASIQRTTPITPDYASHTPIYHLRLVPKRPQSVQSEYDFSKIL